MVFLSTGPLKEVSVKEILLSYWPVNDRKNNDNFSSLKCILFLFN